MKKKNPFGKMQNAAIGIAGLGITSGVVAGIQANAPAGTPNMTQGMNTLASFTPLVATGIGAKSALNVLPKTKKSKKYW